jgi:hypothetical protein
VLTEREARMRRLAIVPMSILFSLATSATAGPEKVAFPAYQTHVLYAVLDQPDIKELREAYINPEAFKALKPGQPLPNGTVLSLPTFKALLDDKGELVKDPNGRLVRGRLDRVVVMEKRTGRGVEYSEDLRNGEWEYARFRADGTRDPQANIKGCFECHMNIVQRDQNPAGCAR